MTLGIFARTFARPDLDGVLEAVAQHGFAAVQLNLACAGLETVPERLESATCAAIRAALERRRLRLAALSGTFNAVHPDVRVRIQGTERCKHLIARAGELGTALVTLCTGSRDPQDMWRRHPDNAKADAWADLVATLGELVPAAERHGVTLGIEPESGNVIDSARAARRLLDEMRSPRLRIVFDAANLIKEEPGARADRVLRDAFDSLRSEIVLAHLKELAPDRSSRPCRPGAGLVNWSSYFRMLHGLDGKVPLIIHGLAEDEVAAAKAFIEHGLAVPSGSRL